MNGDKKTPLLTSCPLDCFDACRLFVDDKIKFKGDKTHPITQGYLCPNLNHYNDYSRILTPRLNNIEISMNEALNLLVKSLNSSKSSDVLYYRGSGNMGLMQKSVEHFFGGFNAIGTSGSLCDGAGESGIIAGRGKNYPLSPQMIEQSEVVIVWGKNPHTSHSHLLPFLANKTLIVIDPLKTSLAQKADIHLQIKPHGDLHLALLLSRFALIERIHDPIFCKERASGYEDFYELTQSVRIKATLEYIDISLGEIGTVLSLIEGKKCVILVGTGVQKYRNGDEVLRAIDGFAALMGWFGKEGCGVSFLGNSTENINIPFNHCRDKVSKATVDFSKYKTIFVQGANPLAQMPASKRVRESFAKAEFKVYFGLYENETSKASNLIIPAKTFLEKNDIRSSYGDFTCETMPKLIDGEWGISEYDLSAFLCQRFGIDIENERTYLDHFKGQIEYIDEIGYRKNSPKIPYINGFEEKEFQFLEEIDLGFDSDGEYHLLTIKHQRGLNSQFYRDSYVYFHPKTGFFEGQKVILKTSFGSVEMEVAFDDRLRVDSLLIYSGTPDVNILTPSLLSYVGENAVYQENKIKVMVKND